MRYLIIASLMALASCDLSKTNINPNASSDVSISAVLTGSEVSIGFNTGVNGGLLANIYIQQVAGANGDAASFDNYTTSPGYFNGTWQGYYVNVLDELKIIQQTATDQSLPYYRGIARVLTAFSYGTLTDLFGDIPYSEALSGNDIRNPVYDKQEAIYTAIQQTLDSAIIDLSKPTATNLGAVPASDDVIFKGHIPSWIATAWTLKARYAIHLSKQNATDAAQKVLSYLYDGSTWRGIAGNAADAQVVFGAATTNANPFYQQNTNRPGWIGLGASFVNLLNGNAVTDAPTKPDGANVDPRRAYFATPNGTTYRGSAPGVPGAFSRIGSYFGTATSPVILVSFAEAKFLEAEARLLLHQDSKAQESLETAVRASFSKVISNPADPFATLQKQTDYIAAKATLNGTNDLSTIITQKYIALFLQPEAWTDYRRTGFPAIPLAQNATHSANPNGQIPRRIPYPQNETSLNKNTPPNSGYQEPKLWWDK